MSSTKVQTSPVVTLGLVGALFATDVAALETCTHVRLLEEATLAARKSWPLVVRNAFGADGAGDEFLRVRTLLPSVPLEGPGCLHDYLIGDLVRQEDDTISGRTIPTNRDFHVLFGVPVVIDPDQLVDWTYQVERGGLIYGGFSHNNGSTNDAIPLNWD